MDETAATEPSGHHAAALVVGLAGAVTIVGAALPWLHSGARSRSSFDLVAVARRLGLSPDGWQGIALRLWPVVPLVCVLATIAAWWGRRHLASVLAVVAAAASAWLAQYVRTVDLSANLRLAAGPAVTILGALLLVVAAVLVQTGMRRAG